MENLINIINNFLIYYNINKKDKEIVLFLENSNDFIYFEKFLIDLYDHLKIKTLILISERRYNKNLKINNFVSNVIFIGDGFFRYLYFRLINTKVFFLTTPDLENSELKRSINHVNYFYIFHSIVSTHMIYNTKAFDNYDYILTVGTHHDKEIRTREKLYNLNKKVLLPLGYPRILKMQDEFYKRKNKRKKLTILIAPTWGKSSITDTCLEKILIILLRYDYQIIFRPHPRSLIEKTTFLNYIKEKYDNMISIQTDVKNTNFLYDIDFLISDWSGFALEFCITTNKNIIFIDTPPKINNKKFKHLKIEPIEKTIRNQIGTILDLNSIDKLGDLIGKLKKNKLRKYKFKFLYDYFENRKFVFDQIKKLLK